MQIVLAKRKSGVTFNVEYYLEYLKVSLKWAFKDIFTTWWFELSKAVSSLKRTHADEIFYLVKKLNYGVIYSHVITFDQVQV